MSSASPSTPDPEHATLRIHPVDDTRSQFLLYSQRGRLLLRSGAITNGQVFDAIDEFQRHCGIRAFYRLRGSPKAWVIELRSTQNRLLAVGGQTLVDDELAQVIIQLAVRQGPFAKVVRPSRRRDRAAPPVDDALA